MALGGYRPNEHRTKHFYYDGLDARFNRITQVADPTDDYDAVNKRTLDDSLLSQSEEVPVITNNQLVTGTGSSDPKLQGESNLTFDGSILQVTGTTRLSDGTASAPAYSFLNETDSGLFRVSANTLGIAVNGTRKITCYDTGGIVFSTTTGTGFGSRAHDGLTINSSNNLQYIADTDFGDDDRCLTVYNDSTTNNAMSIISQRVSSTQSHYAMLDHILKRDNVNSVYYLRFRRNGNFYDNFSFSSTGLFIAPVIAGDSLSISSTSASAFTVNNASDVEEFAVDTNTNLVSVANDLDVNGEILTTDLSATGVIEADVGSATVPSINFGTANTGLYSAGSGEFSVSANGGATVHFYSSGTNYSKPLSIQADDIAVSNFLIKNLAGTTSFFSVSESNAEVNLHASTLKGDITTETQITSITTSVTANGPRCLITTVSTTLAAQSSATFTLTNSSVGSGYLVRAWIQDYSGTYGTNGLPTVNINNIGSGSCDIVVINIDTSALNGVLKIGVDVIKN